jgi:hypothetical protein
MKFEHESEPPNLGVLEGWLLSLMGNGHLSHPAIFAGIIFDIQKAN